MIENQNKQTEKEILNFNEVRELLGVSKSSLYKLTSTNKIPCFRPTKGKLYFKREQVLSWLISEHDFKDDTLTNSNTIENGR